MSTQGHFFVGRGESAEWLGTVWHDGYLDPPGLPAGLRHVYSEAAFRQYVDEMLRDGVCSYARPTTLGVEPVRATGTLTGYMYAFDEGRVWVRLHDDWVPFDAPDALGGPYDVTLYVPFADGPHPAFKYSMDSGDRWPPESDDGARAIAAEVERRLDQIFDDEEWEWERLRLMAMERDRQAPVNVTVGFRLPLDEPAPYAGQTVEVVPVVDVWAKKAR